MSEEPQGPDWKARRSARRPPLIGWVDRVITWDNLDRSVMPDCKGSLDPDGRFAAWNAAMSRLHEKSDR
jgi:hypothetical protein